MDPSETLMEDPSDTIARVLKLVNDVDTKINNGLSTKTKEEGEGEERTQTIAASSTTTSSNKTNDTKQKRRSKLVKGKITAGTATTSSTSNNNHTTAAAAAPPPPPPKDPQQQRSRVRRRSTFNLPTKSSQLKYSCKLQDQYSRIKNAKEYNNFIANYNSMPQKINMEKLAKKHETHHDYMNSIMEAEKNVKILEETKMHLVRITKMNSIHPRFS